MQCAEISLILPLSMTKMLSQMDLVQIINVHPQKLQASQHQFLDDTKRKGCRFTKFVDVCVCFRSNSGKKERKIVGFRSRQTLVIGDLKIIVPMSHGSSD